MKWVDVIWSLFVCVCVLCVYICLGVAVSSYVYIYVCVNVCVCVCSREKLDRRNWGCVCVIMLTCVYVHMSHVCVCECVPTSFVWLGSYNDVVNRGFLIGVAVNGLWSIYQDSFCFSYHDTFFVCCLKNTWGPLSTIDMCGSEWAVWWYVLCVICAVRMGYGYQGSGAVRIRSESDSSAALVFIAQCQKALLIMTCVHNVRFPGKPNN